jgi:CheY-like chemotaxis protein
MRVDTTEMPTVEMRPDAAPVAPSAAPLDRPVSVLVLDDNAEVRSMLAATLREAGYAVVEAIGPGQARDLLATRRFDLAVIDLIMPDENGVDVLQQLRGFEFGARIGGGLRQASRQRGGARQARHADHTARRAATSRPPLRLTKSGR